MNGLEFNTAEAKALHIPALSKGLDLRDIRHSGDHQALIDGYNVWTINGVLETRPGLFTAPDRLISHSEFNGAQYIRTLATDIQAETMGETKSLVIQMIEYDISSHFIVTYFLNSDGTVYSRAVMSFFRVSSDTFYIPQRVNFYKGRPLNGAGLYALVETVNCENSTQVQGIVYELSQDFTEFLRVSSAYVPTVLINGRGNKYEMAKQTNQAFTGTPTRIEGLNVLESDFHAYYSTDGRSSSFRLPFAELSSGRVLARLYYGVNTYVEWNILEGNDSASAQLYGVEVTMQINREKGIVSFTVPAGEYELPLITERNENNLRITACKDSGFSLKDLVAADSVLNKDSKILVGAGSKIFIADIRQPLYFPVESVADLGAADGKITALATVNKKAVAFTGNRIYSLNIQSGDALNFTSLLAENDAIFYKADRITPQCEDYGMGCEQKGSLITAGRRLFWCSGGRFYSMGASMEIQCISDKIAPLLEACGVSFSSACSVRLKNKILFLWDNKALVLENGNKTGEEAVWHYWVFPENLRMLGGFSTAAGEMLLCLNKNGKHSFTAELSGERDIYLKEQSYEIVTEGEQISYKFRTGKLDFGCDNTFKRVDEIRLQLKGNDTKIMVNDRIEARVSRLSPEAFGLIRLTPGLCRINAVDIAFWGAAPIKLGSIDINYTALKL